MKMLTKNFFIVFLLLFFFSCKNNVSRVSERKKLLEIDALIEQGLYADAISELKKIEKKTYDSWTTLGIYRRYKNLGEEKNGIKLLYRALKKNKNNEELSAVLAHALMRNGNTNEAERIGKNLQGTNFGSIYSEIVFQKDFANAENEMRTFDFMTEAYAPLFSDAYAGTKNSSWLRNAALIFLKNGNYEKAFALHPNETFDSLDAYFWALVSFDANEMNVASTFGEKALECYETSSVHARHTVSLLEIASLLSDSYAILSENEKAQKVRMEILSRLEENKAGMNTSDSYVQSVLPSLYVDSALYAWQTENYDECARLLTYAVDTWSDYKPALVAYANFALDTKDFYAEDKIEKTLRDEGLATLEMEAYDNQAKVAASDALWRLSESLQRVPNDEVYITYVSLKNALDEKRSREEKLSDVYLEIEKSERQNHGIVSDLIFEYALSTLLNANEIETAFSLFQKILSRKYTFDNGKDFWKNVNEQFEKFSVREKEYASLFAALQKKADTAIALYEKTIFVGSEKNIDANVSIASLINLANIYESMAQKQEALLLYSDASTRSIRASEKSEIHYRLAKLYAAKGDTASALRSISYALKLRPLFQKAKLLRDTLR